MHNQQRSENRCRVHVLRHLLTDKPAKVSARHLNFLLTLHSPQSLPLPVVVSDRRRHWISLHYTHSSDLHRQTLVAAGLPSKYGKVCFIPFKTSTALLYLVAHTRVSFWTWSVLNGPCATYQNVQNAPVPHHRPGHAPSHSIHIRILKAHQLGCVGLRKALEPRP